ncbi:MAG: spore coat protein GerQ [Bacilli bacterium]
MNTYFNEEIFPNKKEKKEYTPQNIINIPNIEALLKFNKGKKLTIHMGFPNSKEHKDITGILEQSNEEYITLSNPQTGSWNLLPTLYIDYITFDENINYN